MLTAKGKYSLKALAHLATLEPESTTQAIDIAKANNIPKKFLDAILGGERDPAALARLRDPRIKATGETIVKSLHGNWREEHLFTLRQSLELYRTYVKQIATADQKIESLLT